MAQRTDGEQLREEVAGNGAQGELLVRMDEKLTGAVKTLEEVRDDQKTVKDDVQALKVKQASCYAVQETRWTNHKDDHTDLSRRSNILDGVVALGSVALAAIGFGSKS